MDYRRENNGWGTFFEHFWFVGVPFSAMVGSLVLNFFRRLMGVPWIFCYAATLVVAGIGIITILYAKLPLYRRGILFTFGSATIPEERRRYYRWGYRCVIFAVLLFICLSLSRA